jgi:16S rRNA processing protein RimM
MSPETAQDDLLIVARVRRAHGVKGELLVAVETDRPKHVFRPGRILHLADQRANPTGRTLRLDRMRPITGGALLKLDGVESREGADALRGHTLMMSAGDAAPAGPEEVHYRDLVGLTVWNEGTEIGPVEDILDNPGGELLVIRTRGRKELLIPFAREMVVSVDLQARELRLRVPDGLLEL